MRPKGGDSQTVIVPSDDVIYRRYESLVNVRLKKIQYSHYSLFYQTLKDTDHKLLQFKNSIYLRSITSNYQVLCTFLKGKSFTKKEKKE